MGQAGNTEILIGKWAFALIRSKRRTMAIHIKRDASLEVRAPMRATQSAIERFVMSKSAWIGKHLERISAAAADKRSFTLNYGDSILLFGAEHVIVAATAGGAVPFSAVNAVPVGKGLGVGDGCVIIPPGLAPAAIKPALIGMYRRLARQSLGERLHEYAGLMGVAPSSMKITGAKTRWGSCSGKNTINFSWRLIMAPNDAIDYVVVHELAHIRQHNHSPAFWAIVAKHMPDYRLRRDSLKRLHARLASEDWD
ncbi:MAG: M48 family metallopeptidase [Clostridiales bacterium]|jgi:predicted metal-dependent hydrolase|nr:M48 family metallopeptidase [Clostridiales bacterium]